jgi:hypothetical protein
MFRKAYTLQKVLKSQEIRVKYRTRMARRSWSTASDCHALYLYRALRPSGVGGCGPELIDNDAALRGLC